MRATQQREQLIRVFDEMSDSDRESLLRTAIICAKRNSARRATLKLVSLESSSPCLHSLEPPQQSLG
jgi:hypothetical protein